ncbi:MAG: M20/M25/M40 family metallo-hydrolase [Methanoregula sp.]|nr:M20/M25/M40 family metallo-hydrolase [Methanoregula sp.]
MDISRICSELIAIKSENPPGRTTEVIEYIRTFFDTLGIGSKITTTKRGHSNLITTGTGNLLLFCGHVDVVPALDDGWTYPPFSGTIRDGYVWGRGATDMKGGCASLLAACQVLVEQDKNVTATCAFVCDEETGGNDGVRHLLAKKMIKPTDCLIAEPTPVKNPSIGQKGLCRLEMKFTGTPAHGSLYPAVGVSAVMEAMSLLEYVKELHDLDYPVDDRLAEIIDRSSDVLEDEFKIHNVSDVLKKLMYNPGVIKGGEKSNVVAQHCDLELELRVPWGCSIPELISGISSRAPNGKIISQTTHDPSMTDPSCRLVTVTCNEVERVHGGPVFPIVQWAASDARHLRLWGFNVIQYGPGEISTLHAVNERVKIDDLNKASEVYAGIMTAYATKDT